MLIDFLEELTTVETGSLSIIDLPADFSKELTTVETHFSSKRYSFSSGITNKIEKPISGT